MTALEVIHGMAEIVMELESGSKEEVDDAITRANILRDTADELMSKDNKEALLAVFPQMTAISLLHIMSKFNIIDDTDN